VTNVFFYLKAYIFTKVLLVCNFVVDKNRMPLHRGFMLSTLFLSDNSACFAVTEIFSIIQLLLNNFQYATTVIEFLPK